MAVASGQLPYQYEWHLPFRVRNNSDQGLSGIHLEAAQFVIQAEMRKFNQADAFQQQWKVYTNSAIAGSGYDPKVNGATLNGLVGPAVVVSLDQISIARSAMVDGVFGSYEGFSEYNRVQFLDDWAKNLYTNNPSGNGITSTEEYRGQFLRPVLQEDGDEYIPGFFGTNNPVLGPFIETDIHWLGGSGIIFDIDVGEVMWNPYPITTTDILVDTHGTSDNFFILASPFYPMFQKTNGTLVSLNGFENKWPEDRVVSSLINNYNAVGSGKVRYTAYCIFENTDFLFGAMGSINGDVHHIAFSPDQMTVYATSARPLGDSGGNVFGSEVFLNPVALSSGVYHVAARNKKSNFPFTAIESGIASQWPPRADITSTLGAVEASYFGYEVFDNCFWVTDDGIKGSSSSPTGPSGLCVVSPYTGKILWQRNATNDVAGVNYFKPDLSSPAEFFNVYWWDDNTTVPPRSLQRVGTNQIIRMTDRDAAIDPGVSLSIGVATYTDDIASVSNQSVTLSLRITSTIDHQVEVFTMWFDGSSWWVTGRAMNSVTNVFDDFTWELDGSFSELRRISGNFNIGAATRRIGSANGKLFYFNGAGDGLNINEWDIVAAVNPEGFSVTTVATKAINITGIIGGTVQNAQILNVMEVAGATPELESGTYALVRIQTTTAGNKLYIFRIEEDTTEWIVKATWSIRSMVNGITFGILTNMIVMPVN